MSDEQTTGRNFFSTLPGIITAVAGLITAVGSLILILKKDASNNESATADQYVVPYNESDSDDQQVQHTASLHGKTVVFEPGTIRYIDRNIVYQIQKAITEITDDFTKLNIKMECINNSSEAYDLYSNYLEAKIGDDNYKVEPYKPSGDYQSIPANGSKVLEYTVKLPAGVKRFSFQFWDETHWIDSAKFTID